MDIQLDPKDERRLEELARESGKPVGELLRELLAKVLHDRDKNGAQGDLEEEGESFLQAAERIGAVGCIKGGPTDMSTNPNYMKGFGES